MRILLLSRYDRLGASSRLRFFQYLPYFESFGWKVEVSPLLSDAYLRQLYSGEATWREAGTGYLKRVRALAGVKRYDLIWIEKELFPFLSAAGERLLKQSGIPYVVDYDDAMFHRYDQHGWPLVRLLLGGKIDAVMRHAAVVVAGNDYLAEKARQAGAGHVETVPTVIDLERYAICEKNIRKPLVVGWIGTPKTSHYLLDFASAFKSLAAGFDVRFVAVGARQQDLKGTAAEAWPWSEQTEVDLIRQFDIGIMPLRDEPWEKGKCGYKLIQYMACGLPVVASPVGVNNQIVEQGVNGFLAGNQAQWEKALADLLSDAGLRRQMGRHSREKVEALYSLQVQAPRLKAILQQAARGSCPHIRCSAVNQGADTCSGAVFETKA